MTRHFTDMKLGKRVMSATRAAATTTSEAESSPSSSPHTLSAHTPPSTDDDDHDDDSDSQTQGGISLTMSDPYSIITHGALKAIADGNTIAEPVLQCVQIKPMAQGQGGQERWRVVFNDTNNFIQGMIAQQSNWLVNEGRLQKGSICRLTNYVPNYVKDKHILIIMDLQVLEEYGQPEKIGQPVAIEGAKPEGQQEDVKPQPGNIAGNNFYGNKPQAQAPVQQQQQQQSRSLPARTNGASHGGSHGMITPIEAVSPYTHKWTIKARCTSKGDIRTWHNKNGEGKLFSVNFLDESGEIRATAFNAELDTWYEVLQEGSVYYISSPCKVQMAKKQFNNTNNDYELTFDKDTMIEKAEDTEGVPQVQYNFTTLADLQGTEKDAIIDVIGVLQDVGEVSEITSKTTGKPFNKRELTLVDNTGFNVRLTIWGKTASSFEGQPEQIVAFKGVKVSDFNGRSLSLLSSGTMSLDPDIEESYKLKGWYDGDGRTAQFASHANTMPTSGATSGGKSDYKTIAAVRDENLGMGEDTDWFSIKATTVYIKHDNFAYPACRTTDPAPCNKKVNEEDTGVWRCEKCNVTWDAPNYRYVMSINVSDHTGQIWLSCFDDVGEKIMGVSANQLMALKEEGNDRAVTEAFGDANCKTFSWRCKAKMDTFQDQQRVRYQVNSANPLNYAAESKKLADLIKQYTIQDNSLFVQ